MTQEGFPLGQGTFSSGKRFVQRGKLRVGRKGGPGEDDFLHQRKESRVRKPFGGKDATGAGRGGEVSLIKESVRRKERRPR